MNYRELDDRYTALDVANIIVYGKPFSIKGVPMETQLKAHKLITALRDWEMQCGRKLTGP
jgi:hypothetical protein